MLEPAFLGKEKFFRFLNTSILSELKLHLAIIKCQLCSKMDFKFNCKSYFSNGPVGGFFG